MTEKSIDIMDDQLEKWLSEQPLWVQDATYRLCHALEIDASTIRKYTDMCISEVKKEEVSYSKIDLKVCSVEEQPTSLSILKLGNINCVNALSSQSELSFSKNGITVVYGLNGSGKSGYMRMFKKACGSLYAEPIERNVYSKKDEDKVQKCDIRIEKNGVEETHTIDFNETEGLVELKKCDVFDTPISTAYIQSSNNVSYQPFIFTVMSRLANIADEIKTEIESRKKCIDLPSINVPKEFVEEEYAGWLSKIDNNTIIPDDIRIWTEDDEKSLTSLEKVLSTENHAEIIAHINEKKNKLSALVEDLKQIENSFSIDNRKKAIELCNTFIKREKEADLAKHLFEEESTKIDKTTASASEFKELWKYANLYYSRHMRAIINQDFATEGSICPLCHQAIDDDISKRMTKVNEYVNGACSTELQKAKNDFVAHVTIMAQRSLSSDLIPSFIESDISAEELQEVISVYDEIKLINDEKESVRGVTERINGIDVKKPKTVVDSIIEKLDEEIKLHTNVEDKEKVTSLKEEQKKLKYRKWANDCISLINELVLQKKRIASLDKCLNLVNTRRITNKSNELADALITDAYIERFHKEMSRLARDIKVKLTKGKSQKGRSPYKIEIDSDGNDSIKTEKILSEGEQRIVALAAFFADATGRKELTPLIIDDPISSLDLQYEDNATQRIIELAESRQVIVFTHRISLLVDIKEKAERMGVNCKEEFIRAGKDGKGIPEHDNIYHGNISKQLKAIREGVKSLKKKDPDSIEYDALISAACSDLRICIERSVEDVLLQTIVCRFRRNIRTKNILKKLDRIDSTDCEIIDSMMTKYSFAEHSQPMDSAPINFTPNEIEEDINNLLNWIDGYNKKMN